MFFLGLVIFFAILSAFMTRCFFLSVEDVKSLQYTNEILQKTSDHTIDSLETEVEYVKIQFYLDAAKDLGGLYTTTLVFNWSPRRDRVSDFHREFFNRFGKLADEFFQIEIQKVQSKDDFGVFKIKIDVISDLYDFHRSPGWEKYELLCQKYK